MSSTCFQHPSVHPQEDLYMQFYGISFMHPYKESGWWQDVLKVSSTSCLRPDCLYGCMKYHKTACKSLPQDEHLDVRNMSKTIQLNYRGADKSLARPGRKQANFFVGMAWICFGALPCRGGGDLMTARVSILFKSVFLNRRAAARYRALASIIPGRERFSWNLSL